MPTKVLLVGYGRAGKDCSGEWLHANRNCVYGGSTSLFLAKHVAPVLGQSEEQCYRERHQNRDVWYQTGRQLREKDPGCLLRTGLALGNVVAGVRDLCELRAARDQKLVDVIVWIENPRVPVDPTVEFTKEDCDLVLLNEADLPTLYGRLAVFANLCGF